MVAARDLLGTLERLLEIQATDESVALREASNVIHRALGADKVDIFLFDGASTSLVAGGTSDTPMGRKQHELGLDRLPLANGGRSVQVYRTGRSYIAGDARQDSEELRGLTEGLGIRSRLAVPLHVDAARRGTVEVCSATAHLFSEDDLRFLGAAARWIGALMHRLELGASMRAKSKEEGRRQAAEQVFAVLAHDLRNILNSASIRLALMRERALNEERDPDIRDSALLAAALRRLIQMTNNLLDVNRLDRGLFSLHKSLVDVVALARQATMALRRGEIEIEERYPESLVTSADADRLSRALENLISNAIKYSPRGGTVRVQIELRDDAEGPRCLIRVADNGPGIPPELLPRIFDPYVTADGSQGLGLGLYLARGVALAHGGSLEVRSTARGTVFELSLPVLE